MWNRQRRFIPYSPWIVLLAAITSLAVAGGLEDLTGQKVKFVVVAKVLDVKGFSHSGPLSEHNPIWQEATVEVTVASGQFKPGQKPIVRFAGSRDIAWFNTPKLKAGETARLGLRLDDTTKLGKASIDGKEVDAYYLLTKDRAPTTASAPAAERGLETGLVRRVRQGRPARS